MADNTNTPPDVDELPDAVPAQGAITFDPAPSLITLTNSKDIVVPDSIVVVLEDGKLDEWLVANTNSNPANWTYNVSFNIIGVVIPSFNIEIVEGADIDLFDYLPAGIDQNTGELTLRGPAGPAGTGGSGELQTHIDAATPHPAYDTDLPDLTVLFENGLI